jgi:hypothetical protein
VFSMQGVEEERMGESERLRLAEAVRSELLRVALRAYDGARLDGVCEEGALEVAIDAMRSLDLRPLVRGVSPSGGQ